jgi:hypothetical protein
MKEFIIFENYVFNQEYLVKYNLSFQDIAFISVMRSTSIYNEDFIPTLENTFYFINYKLLVLYYPAIFKNINQVKKTINKISSKKNNIVLNKPLILKKIKNKNTTKFYFALNNKIFEKIFIN